MDLAWIVIWPAVAVFAVAYISYLLYQLFYKLRNLFIESVALQQAALEAKQQAAAESQEFERAKSTDPNNLFQLLGQRRKRKRQIERKKRDRRRRLIDRISKIEINERFR